MRQSFGTVSLTIAVSCALLLSAGCRGDPEARSLREKARRVKQLRDQADDCWARWQMSKGADLEELECFVEKQRLTTEVYASAADCPECYMNYARALRVLGGYYRTLMTLKERELASASPRAVPALEEDVRRAHEKVVAHLTLSNEMFETYFQFVPGRGGRAYLWVSDSYAELGDYDRALRYLKLFSDTWDLKGENLEFVEERRRTYQKLYDKQQMDRLREKQDA